MLDIEGLHVGYGGVPALNGVSLRVGAGELIAVVGPNGAGKTTLFNAISGLVTATAGSIRFAGEDLLKVPPSRRAHLGLAHVPEGRQVFPSLTVRENLEMGAYTDAGRAAWTRSLESIYAWFPKLAERGRQLAGTLSGGEQQMLAISRGLASVAEAPDARRAVDGAVARDRRRDLRANRLDSSRREAQRAARRAARGRGAAPSRSRLCARERPSDPRRRSRRRCRTTTGSGAPISGCSAPLTIIAAHINRAAGEPPRAPEVSPPAQGPPGRVYSRRTCAQALAIISGPGYTQSATTSFAANEPNAKSNPPLPTSAVDGCSKPPSI